MKYAQRLFQKKGLLYKAKDNRSLISPQERGFPFLVLVLNSQRDIISGIAHMVLEGPGNHRHAPPWSQVWLHESGWFNSRILSLSHLITGVTAGLSDLFRDF